MQSPAGKMRENALMMKRLFLTLLSLSLLAPIASVAEEDIYASDMAQIKKRLFEVRPDIPIIDIQPTEMKGIYQVSLPAGQVLHFSADGEFFFSGDLYKLEGRLVNLTEEGRATGRKELIDNLDESQMVVFSPSKERLKATITVFTDIDCVFCRKLHNEVPELNRLGIAVRYLAYPRSGTNTPSYDKLVSAWCADNPQIALTRAKAGQDIPEAKCVNPIASQYELAARLGINSTPSVIYEDGSLMPGYKTADEFARILGVLN